MAVDSYKSNGGKLTCSPNQSCEGDTSDSVILKDFHGHLVAEIVLPTKTVKLATKTVKLAAKTVKLASSDGSMAGAFCNVVAVLTLVGGVGSALAAMDSYDPDVAGIFAIGSIANSTRRSAISAQRMAQLMIEQENRRRAATPDT
ncbi:MAG: hypothetical protein TH68_05120 [Candidatus Synechococcus spongiarum 142]|uniref:Uncharacterized protein n=1 Tax=Candidatus Synechococcus spongiarum 142 TaxID=1608213 RepID=A0A6N3X6R1_9SYNE|nr:MAG: hypothetical protein TH68_05120 [Candidatus Synechococcus spongiarum 142]